MTTAHHGPPTVTDLTPQEREVLYAIGCGLKDTEIADALALTEHAVSGHLGRILTKLGLRDRAAAIVHAFDCGLVVPGYGPRRQAAAPVPQLIVRRRTPPPADPWLRISVLGPLQAWSAGQPVDLGPVRQQAVLAALALCPDRAVSRQELLDGVWGMEPPAGNVVPVYIYRLRKILRLRDHCDAVISRDRFGYRLAHGAVELDVARMERLAVASGAAGRAGDLSEAVRLCSRALDLFRGEPLAGLPGPSAELERLRLAERRLRLVQQKADWQLRLGRCAEVTAELSAMTIAQPTNEPLAALLMCALQRSGRQAEALAVFDRTHRQLADSLGVAPSGTLRRARRAILHGDEISLTLGQAV